MHHLQGDNGTITVVGGPARQALERRQYVYTVQHTNYIEECVCAIPQYGICVCVFWTAASLTNFDLTTCIAKFIDDVYSY